MASSLSIKNLQWSTHAIWYGHCFVEVAVAVSILHAAPSPVNTEEFEHARFMQ
jgi:hypothetical protein